MKDHQIAALVNTLRDIAVEFHGAQQLRERISQAVCAALHSDAAQAPYSAPFTTDVPQCCGDPSTCNDLCDDVAPGAAAQGES